MQTAERTAAGAARCTARDDVALRGRDRALAIWLLACCVMVLIMMALGAVTRLTHSGLSIVEWKPLTGVLPPFTEGEWQGAFDRYRQYPEYQKVNRDMTLAGYKSIFWLEYTHRLWGRLIGVVFAAGLAWFALTGRLDRALVPRLVAMFLLGGFQGALGWYMVRSGLVSHPDVSHYRLTAHLIAAVLLYAYMLWVALDLLAPRAASDTPVPLPQRRLRRRVTALLVLVGITVASGGLVAGLDAGFVYNDFPFMAGKLIPDGLFALAPAARNFVDNIITVQFQHRLLALTVLVAAALLWRRARRTDLPPGPRRAFHAMAALAVVQVSLGIATLWLYVPVALATVHELVGILLLTAVLWGAHELRREW